jgi:hypothetical protein
MTARIIPAPITLREANAFVEQFHRHSDRTSRDGGKYAIAAEVDEMIVGVAIVGRPVSRILAADRFCGEVLRACVSPEAPRNVNSFLYGACWRAWRAMGGRKLITYTLQTESGESLRGAGWKIIAEVKGHKDGWESTGRRREWKPIYGQQKLRWEVTI